jgi:hypothetical protein
MYLTNATIWVEGVTDRLYLRAFLGRYIQGHAKYKQLREDVHYVLAEVGGSCVVHWNFEDNGEALLEEIKVSLLCGENFLVLDGDNAPKADRIEKFKKQLKDNFYLLKLKEIENLLPETVVRVAAEKLNTRELGEVNFQKIQAAEYQKSGIGLGKYLDGLFAGDHFGTTSGTMKRKVDFCDKAVEEMQLSTDWDLPEEAKHLCEKILEFVAEANHLPIAES